MKIEGVGWWKTDGNEEGLLRVFLEGGSAAMDAIW